MIKNKLLKSTFALILALSMLVPGFGTGLYAEQPKSDLRIAKIVKATEGWSVITLETADMVQSVNKIKVNGTEYTYDQKSVKKGENHWRRPKYKPSQIHLSPMQNGDVLSLVTEKGTTTVKVLKANLSWNNAQGAFNPQDIVFTPTGAAESDMVLNLKAHKQNQYYDFYATATDAKGQKLELEGQMKGLSVDGKAYNPVSSKIQVFDEGVYYISGEKIHFYEPEDNETVSITDKNNKVHNFKFVNGDFSKIEDEQAAVDFKLRIKGHFEAAMLNQTKYDAVSGATTGGAVNNQNSDVLVQYTKKEKPEEADWVNLSEENPAQNDIQIVFTDESGKAVDCGMKGVFSNVNSKLTLSGRPNRVGKYKIKFVYNRDNTKIESNALDFNVYGLDEKLEDYYKVDNAKPFEHGGKYYWNVEPWYMKHFGGQNETVIAPKEIKAVFGSNTSGTYGVWGYPIAETVKPTQTLIVGKDTDLTLVNMKLLSSIEIIVKDGGKLNLRDSSLHGRIVVEGGTLEVNYDARTGEFLKGSSINGQIELRDGATLTNSLIYSNTNSLPNGDGSNDVPAARHNVKPVLLITGNAKIDGKVFVRGDEAPSGADASTNKPYTGQPAIGLKDGAILTVPEGSILGAYGGGWTNLTTNGGAALVMEDNSSVTGEGSLIAMPGATTLGAGSHAVVGSGKLAVKQLYIHGGNSSDSVGGKPLADTVTVDMGVKPIGKLFDGKSKSELFGSMEYDDPYYWLSTVDTPEYDYLKSETKAITMEGGVSPQPQPEPEKLVINLKADGLGAFDHFHLIATDAEGSPLNLEDIVKEISVSAKKYDKVDSIPQSWTEGKYHLTDNKIYMYKLRDNDLLEMKDNNGDIHRYNYSNNTLTILLPPSSEPEEPQPQPEPEQPEPGQPEPEQPEPGQPEPGQPEPGQPEPEQPGPEQPEPGQPEPEQPEPEQPEPGQPEPGQPEPGQPEPGQPGPEQPEPGQPEPEQPGPEPQPQLNLPGNTEPFDNGGATGGSSDDYQAYDGDDTNETINDDKTPLGTAKTEISLDEFKPEVKEALEAVMNHSAEDKAVVENFLNRKISPVDFASGISEEAIEVSKKAVFKLFKDVPETAWYAKELNLLHMIKLITGYEDQTFRPNNMVTAKELVTILARAGEWEIKVMEGDWFVPYFETAKTKGLLEGLDLDPAKAMTREEIAGLLYNFIKVQKGEEMKAEGELKFGDKDKISESYSTQVAFLVEKHIMKGYADNNFMPKDNVKRSEIVAIVYRVLRMK